MYTDPRTVSGVLQENSMLGEVGEWIAKALVIFTTPEEKEKEKEKKTMKREED
tara:strand:+ start:527 stop:685 length:159 start_codon:yes stop_codon:yes gene_type:complete